MHRLLLVKKMIIRNEFLLRAAMVVMIITFASVDGMSAVMQENRNLNEPTDTSRFIPNQFEGWSLVGSYFKIEGDSITAELTVLRNLPGGMSWGTVTFLGVMDVLYTPGYEQIVTFNEPNRIWQAIIKSDGKCFIQLISGPFPTGNIFTLPVKLIFKK
ncbi:MAG: hypothetical protein NTW29_12090 [Bacteroidetes bacterium]|nr:hypothetical protein [Bacteroidota bacterium]